MFGDTFGADSTDDVMWEMSCVPRAKSLRLHMTPPLGVERAPLYSMSGIRQSQHESANGSYGGRNALKMTPHSRQDVLDKDVPCHDRPLIIVCVIV